MLCRLYNSVDVFAFSKDGHGQSNASAIVNRCRLLFCAIRHIFPFIGLGIQSLKLENKFLVCFCRLLCCFNGFLRVHKYLVERRHIRIYHMPFRAAKICVSGRNDPTG